MNTTNKMLLLIGTVQTILMALYHFFIPYQFNWCNFLSEKTPTINWSLFALNNYFSFNLLLLASFLLYQLIKPINRLHSIKILTTIVILFWMFSAVYQLIHPMPLPSNLNWLSYLLPTIAFVNITIIGIPLIALFKRDISTI